MESSEPVRQNSAWAEYVEGNHFDKSLQGGRRVRGELTNRKTTGLHAQHEQNIQIWIRPSNSNATWSLYSATATNSSPCKKHGGGGVPSIIHLEIDRCASPETTGWIVCVAVNSACEFVSIEIGVRVQHEKVSYDAAPNPIPPLLMAQIPTQESSAAPPRCFMLMQQWIECGLRSTCCYGFARFKKKPNKALCSLLTTLF